MDRRAVLRHLLLCPGLPVLGAARADEASLWRLLQGGGQVVLLRHAATPPGAGDPPGFVLGECRTQRNLSDEGRRDARRLGQLLRARGIPMERVLSSPWCRCLETARLAFGREPVVEPALGNVFGRPERVSGQVAELRRLITGAGGGNVFMVTHGSTISALTGVLPDQGEMVVLSPQAGGDFQVAGRLAAPS
ncbi:histidine phosphatase family protein [Ramlibacter sp. AW1]|uniref:Histidine phosphatase family protein n=1 Tax=Ramlibacter aurantiacus TaxID=2801330 RepID=A0A936ZNK1_9BURK|nr:histidine phosphatase family protein [Ramlibacter aurantiacus]MBL0420610.1 histidine phosphatase family protein [Ramlibacter aurantiacus]